jgi:hypothetical protein
MELSLHKLIATPILLFTAITMAFLYVEDTAASIRMLERLLPMLFWMFICLGGSYTVANAIHREHDGKTWDWIRLNSQSVWSITWGTVLGASSFMWYCGSWCLAAYFALPFLSPQEAPVTIQTGNLLLIFVLAIFLQGASMMSICLIFTGAKRNAYSKRSAAISATLLALILFPYHDWHNISDVRWYKFEIPALAAATISAAVFAVWSWTGSLRLLRTQLQYRNGIAVWVIFNIFFIIFLNGFFTATDFVSKETSDSFRHEKILFYAGFYISIALAYIMLFMDPPSIKTFNNLASYIKARNWIRIEQTLPLWVVSSILSIFILIPTIALTTADWIHDKTLLFFSISIIFLLIRDGAIFTAFSYGKNPQRAQITTFIYLFFLYAVIPFIALKLSDNKDILKIFLPGISPFSPIIMFAHAAIACTWAGSRIVRHQKLLHSSTK